MSGTTGEHVAGCSKCPSSKAAGESKPEAYPRGYVEDFDESRTKLAGIFSILLDHFSEVFDGANEGIFELHLRFPFQEGARPADIGPPDFGIIGGQRKMGDVAQ
jgi:hypothetical protein